MAPGQALTQTVGELVFKTPSLTAVVREVVDTTHVTA